ncbi:unnamed protein product [Zymoseptoria tritici ST99CH_1E4]|uniref:Enoyl reductase (ER) domain-containing protein n=1 Tax=Zymoseptoria tritici ST99CH_1E4 TaxID=1276532 RepID=A0A2H1FK93_ZYMTR|nr:unnamed protein product [Zymoseptoria tritici ST99CH_1E4]
MVQNKALIFAKVPSGWPVPGQDLTIESTEFDTEQAPPQGGFTAKVHYVSFDPYQRGRMRAPESKSYSPPFELGKPIDNSAILSVIKSDNEKFKEGSLVHAGRHATEEYSVITKEAADSANYNPLNNQYNLDPKLFIGALGMPGLTAYSSFYEIGQPKKGETIFISAASGAVGQIVGQLAKHEGLKVIGSVGDDKKLDFITKQLGFDGGFNYKTEKPMDALKRLAPDGIDIYYENVGGEQLDAAIQNANNFARIIACGMVSQYNLKPEEAYGVKSLMQVVAKRLKMQGFIVMDENMGPKYWKQHQENVQKWLHDGSFKAEMSTTVGIDNAAEGLIGMLAGKNFGKAVLEKLRHKTSESQPVPCKIDPYSKHCQMKMLSAARSFLRAALCCGGRSKQPVEFEMMPPPARRVEQHHTRNEQPAPTREPITPEQKPTKAKTRSQSAKWDRGDEVEVTQIPHGRKWESTRAEVPLFRPGDARATLPSQRRPLEDVQTSRPIAQVEGKSDSWHQRFPRSSSLAVIGEAL